MKTRYAREADASSRRFGGAASVGSEEVRPGVIFDVEGKSVGIAVPDVSKQMTDGIATTLSNAA